MLSFRIVATRAGYVGLVAGQRGLRRVFLPESDAQKLHRLISRAFPDVREDANLLPELADHLQRYFDGEPVEFHTRLDWSDCHAFEIDVWRACAEVGYGATATYKVLAERVGRPGGARAVGMAMGRNPFPIIIPCHRILKSDGSLGGYSGPGGVEFKRRLLEMEAVHEGAAHHAATA